MTEETQRLTILGTEVMYKFRPAAQDRKHLIVIFSGFRKIDTYDFDGASATGLRANILWIQDNFSNNYSYYTGPHMSSAIDKSVHALIEKYRSLLGLNKSNVTVAGFSKGGSAAIIYGLRHDYGAILAVVPQLKIGSYVKKNWPKVHEFMISGNSTDDTIQLDSIISDLINDDLNTKRNIYLFSSQSDPQHEAEITPLLELLPKYDNFNYIETNSPIVDSHNIVTRYNVPLITSILSALTDNAIPRFGKVTNGSTLHTSEHKQATLEDLQSSKKFVSNTTKMTVEENRLYLEGHAFFKGYEASSYGSVRVKLIIENNEKRIHAPLGTNKNKDLSYQYFSQIFCNYTYGAFSTLASKGLSMDVIPMGTSSLKINIQHSTNECTVPLTSSRPLSAWRMSGSDLVQLTSDNSASIVRRRSPLGIQSADTYFTLDTLEILDTKLHLQGYFIQPGFGTPDYGDVVYYVVLCDSESGAPEYTIPIASDHRPDTALFSKDEWHDYSKSYFATRAYKGVDVSHVTPGTYDIYISARFQDAIFTKKAMAQFSVSPAQFTSDRPTISVLGSCVSRDVFNTKLAPNWKKLYSIGAEHYQSSLVSLMSTPISVNPRDFNDLDRHSQSVTVRDFSKQFLEETIANPPGYILVDFFADARFGVVEHNGSFVTDNAWKLHESDYHNLMLSSRRVSMQSDRDEYLNRFRSAAKSFAELRNQHFPGTTIIINKARAVPSFIAEDQLGQFSQKDISTLNSNWDSLEREFHDIVGGVYITGMSDNLMGDGGHPWGPGPVHYLPSYYRTLQNELFNATDTRSMNLKVQRTASAI